MDLKTLQDWNKFIILMWSIVGVFLIICSVDFIYIELFTRIIQIEYSFLEYFICPDWNYFLFQIYWIE